MKKYYIVLYILVILCIAGSAVIMILSPDTIPLHYDYKGEIDRWGSKYENLMFPIISVLLGVLLTAAAKAQSKNENTSNEKVMLAAGAIILVFFDAVTFYLGVKALAASNAEGYSAVPSIGKFVGIAMGALLLLLGNIMPKARKNSVFGLRTKWSMANDRVWQKSQRFCGITLVIFGICQIIASILLSNVWILISLIAFSVVFMVLGIVSSYRYYIVDIKTISNAGGKNA